MSERAAAHVFVDDVERPVVADADRHHLERVLRLRLGETVTVSDGRGRVRVCRFAAGGVLEPAEEATEAEPRSPAIAVGFALVKGERPELIVQKLTESGVDRIIPFVAERSVVRWDEAKAERNLARLRSVAREAAMQSRQRWLPTVEPVQPFAAVAAPGVTRADFDGDPPSLEHPVVLVGPEGGWSEAERALVPASTTLGPSVLRAETAAIAAAVVLSGLRSGIVAPASRRAARSRLPDPNAQGG